MAKDIEEKKLRKEKKDKKEKKEKRAESDGVSKSKKDKKEKKSKADVDMADALEVELEKAPEDSLVNVVDGEEPRGALVPFAFPLADNDKEVKKILKTVKKCKFVRLQPTASSSAPCNHPPNQPKRHTNPTPPRSRKNQNPPPRRQRSRQSAAQIRRLSPVFVGHF